MSLPDTDTNTNALPVVSEPQVPTTSRPVSQDQDSEMSLQSINEVLLSNRLEPGASIEPQQNKDTPISKSGKESLANDPIQHTGILDFATSAPEPVEDDVAPTTQSLSTGLQSALVLRRPRTLNGLSKGIVNGRRVSVANDPQYHTPEDKTATDMADGMLSKLKRRWGETWRSGDFSSDERLEDQLKRAIVASPDTHKRFLPKGELIRLVTRRAVEIELIRYEYSLRKRLQIWKPSARLEADIRVESHTICPGIGNAMSESGTEDENGPRDAQKPDETSYQKIFAILLIIGQPQRIRAFLDDRVSDADLPLTKAFLDDRVSDADLPLTKMSRTTRRQSHLELCRKGSNTPLLCFKKWRDSTVAQFEQCQWIVLAPFFSKLTGEKNSHLELERDEILPFTSWTKAADPGGSGQVYKAEIHPDHHALRTGDEPTNVFAVKALASRNKEAFMQEAGILKSLSGQTHTRPHLITLLLTYEQFGKYHLVFPWAEADLLGYWRDKNPSPSRDIHSARWLAEQCQGLAAGLSAIHRYKTFSGTSLPYYKTCAHAYPLDPSPTSPSNPSSKPAQSQHLFFGRHGDIKANNILWFPSPPGTHGTLRITDFGITRFGTENTLPHHRGPVANSPTYRAPECDLAGAKLGISCDVWALGCVYLEFLTWFVGGWQRLERFAHERLAVDEKWGRMPCDTFFAIKKDGKSGAVVAEVKPCVIQLIDELRSTITCTEFFPGFLDIIQREMLIVEHSDQGGSETVRRKGSGNIALELGSMKEQNCKLFADE